jgi:hypothetical protein
LLDAVSSYEDRWSIGHRGWKCKKYSSPESASIGFACGRSRYPVLRLGAGSAGVDRGGGASFGLNPLENTGEPEADRGIGGWTMDWAREKGEDANGFGADVCGLMLRGMGVV